MFRLVIDLEFDLVLVSADAFETREAAAMAQIEGYSSYTAMEIRTQEEVDKLSARKVTFGVPKV